jgi:hypothetical protein
MTRYGGARGRAGSCCFAPGTSPRRVKETEKALRVGQFSYPVTFSYAQMGSFRQKRRRGRCKTVCHDFSQHIGRGAESAERR